MPSNLSTMQYQCTVLLVGLSLMLHELSTPTQGTLVNDIQDDNQLLDLTRFTSAELQDTFGVTEHQHVPSYRSLYPLVTRHASQHPHAGRLQSLQVSLHDVAASTIENETVHLKLPLSVVDHELFVSDLHGVQREENDTHTFTIGHKPDSCHYQSLGNRTVAAVSDCGGVLKGLIIHDGIIYALHPVPERHDAQNRQKRSTANHDVSFGLHVIYKRSLDNTTSHYENEHGELKEFCGSDAMNMTEDDLMFKDAGVDSDDEESTFEALAVIANRLTSTSDLVVELGVFADQKLWSIFNQRHGSSAEQELKNYVATVVNSIQIIYRQPTMMPPLKFKVTRLEIMKRQPRAIRDSIHSNGHAQMYLDNFCRYQNRMSPKNWDHAFLLSGYDLHRGYHSKSISGIARLNGMCDSWNTCTVTEGKDFTSVFIGAHELGHSIGMHHDEPYCPSKYIMSASLGPGKTTWSSCSMRDYHKFIQKKDRRGRNCLRDTQHPEVVSSSLSSLPGQKFTADQQCSMMHGSGYKMVRPRNDNYDTLCYMMWCGLSAWGRIITSHPALEGTSCRDGKWCRQGRCVPYTATDNVNPSNPAPGPSPEWKRVDGSWSPWSSVSCSQCKCGELKGSIGVLRSTRSCNSPAPQNGGDNCDGAKSMGVVCSRDCDRTATKDLTNYMDDICRDHRATKRDYEITGEATRFLKHSNRACKIFCKQVVSSATSVSYRYYGDLLPDGTPCSYRNSEPKFCVDGECLELSCNDKALSTRKRGCPTRTCDFDNPVTISVDAQWSSWSAWSYCSVTCGEGKKRRARRCSIDGKCRGDSEESQSCNEKSCPGGSRKSEWSAWNSWSSCSVTCGTGRQERDRRCSDYRSYCWGSKTEARNCDMGWCEWSEWSSCSRSCGSGTQRRSRSCPGNQCVGSFYDDQKCNEQDCRRTTKSGWSNRGKDIAWSTWNHWSDCSVTCGGKGSRYRSRSCNGRDCPLKEETEHDNCGTDYCEWSDWSECSVTCGYSGTRTRTRTCPFGGCSSEDNEGYAKVESCYEGQCHRSRWKAWGEWTTCSVTCGKGIKARYRRCARGTRSADCEGDASERDECDRGSCSDRSGEWMEWNSWSPCSVTCGVGMKARERQFSSDCYNQGPNCVGISHQRMTCDTESPCFGPSTTDGSVWSTWSAWNTCSKQCGAGIKSRQRTCSISGNCVGNTLESIPCNTFACSDQDSSITWHNWGPWSVCSRTCGKGQRQRFRRCSPSNRCQRDRELEDCEVDSQCPGDNDNDSSEQLDNTNNWGNNWSTWSTWSACSAHCGLGRKVRRRVCPVDHECPGLSKEHQSCNSRSCAEWGGWGYWGTCSRLCGYGNRRRIRNCYGWGNCSGAKEQLENCIITHC